MLQHRLRAFGTHFVHFAAAESTVQASRGWQELARWGLGLCLDHQYVCQGDRLAGPLERKLQRVPKVATRFANCQLPIGGEEHRESLHALILCPQMIYKAWYSLLITTTMDYKMPTPCTGSCLAEISFSGLVLM